MSQLSINLEIIGAERVNNVLKSVEQKLKELRKLNANSGRDSKKLYDGEINSAKKLYEFKTREEIKLANWKERELYKQNQRELNAARKLNNEKRRGGETQGRGGRLARGVAGGMIRGGLALGAAAGLGAGISAIITNAMEAADRRNEVSRSLLPFMTQLEGFKGGGEDKFYQKQLTENVMSTSAKTGISSDELVRSLLTAQGMGGNGALYAKNLDKFATIAQAYGISIEDVMKTAATSFVNLPEEMKKNQEEGMKAVFDQMSTVIGGGKAGTLSPELISEIFGKLSANAKGVGGDYNKNVKTQLGLAQMIAPSVGSPEEIASTLKALTADLVGKSEELKGKYGIETIQNGKVRDPLEVMKEFLEKTKGNVKAQMLFGEASRKAVMALAGFYQDGGIARINSEFDKVTVSIDNLEQALQFAKEDVDQKSKNNAELAKTMAEAGDQFNAVLLEAAPLILEFAKDMAMVAKGLGRFINSPTSQREDFETDMRIQNAQNKINAARSDLNKSPIEKEVERQNNLHKIDKDAILEAAKTDPENTHLGKNGKSLFVSGKEFDLATAPEEFKQVAAELLAAAKATNQAATKLNRNTSPVGTGK